MLNYIEQDASLIRAFLPEDAELPEGADGLFRLYAVLMRAKGADVEASDVHDAWSAWMTGIDPRHESVLPFDELDASTKAEDGPFLAAIRRAARERSSDGTDVSRNGS
jgi:hypothetical protein